MEWIKVEEKLPRVFSHTSSDLCLVWLTEEGKPFRFGFPSVGHYNEKEQSWMDEVGAMDHTGYKVTHWAEVPTPEE